MSGGSVRFYHKIELRSINYIESVKLDLALILSLSKESLVMLERLGLSKAEHTDNSQQIFL